MNRTCELHKYDEQGRHHLCGAMAVSIWRSRDGDIAVCEQCEAMIGDVSARSPTVISGSFRKLED